MATVDSLEAAGVLFPVGVRIIPPEKPIRHFSGTERCKDWIANVFTTDPASPDGLEESPKLQLRNRFKQFQTGKPLVFDIEFHPLIPGEKNIWEIKTADVRIFGFFNKIDLFVGVIADYAWRVKTYNLYNGYLREVESFRYYNSLDYIRENGVHYVIS